MKYYKSISLKDGRECILRSGTDADGQAALDNYNLTHAQTDYLTSYPDESTMTAESEAQMLQSKEESLREAELLAEIDGVVVGLAGIFSVDSRFKVKHRAEMGIGVDQSYWGLGVGTALLNACIECAKSAGYTQLELSVVAENDRALSMYRRAGFTEFGRNPKGFFSRYSGYQELVFMRLEL